MLKNFKLSVAIVIMTAPCFGAIAQTKTHKDVVLDGKPAKLDVKTGEVKVVELKTINGKKVEKDTTANTVIKANLITATDNTKTLDSSKARLSVEKPKEFVKIDTTKVAKSAPMTNSEKATVMVYDTATTKVEEENNTNFHKVKQGETLYSLSKRYNTTLAALMKANSLETTLIKTGQTLRVRNFETLSTAGTWTVSKGDTLYSIAKKNNTTVDAIKQRNGLSSNLIKVGQILQLK